MIEASSADDACGAAPQGDPMAREQHAGRGVEGTGRVRTVAIDGLLSGIEYPITRRELVSRARRDDVPTVVVRALNDLPERDYANPTDVMREIGNFM
jgi:hypothetical protein